MAADFTGVDIYFCFLSGSFKFEDRAAVGGRVLNIEQGAIPSGTLVIVYVRVYGIFRVETVGQGNWLPNGYSFRRTGGDCTYGFPNTSEITFEIFPLVGQPDSLAGGNLGTCRKGKYGKGCQYLDK